MKRLSEQLKAFKSRGQTALIPYITAGIPNADSTVNLLCELEKEGCAAVELGIPFSDPAADGNINMRAMEIALERGASLKNSLEIIRKVRARGCRLPIIVFSYLNPLLAMGYETFARSAAEAGADAVLCVDLPLEQLDEVWKPFTEAGLEMVLLSAPTTQGERLEFFEKYPPAFIYNVSRLGVTGTQTGLTSTLQKEVETLRTKTRNRFPICVGFGISTTGHVRTVSEFADGVIAGSVLMQELVHSPDENGCRALIAKVRELLS